jgi:uncharacterized OB-fold protein
MENHQDKIIDSKFIPENGSHTEIIDGEEYLIANDAMYTFYRRTKGEFSKFFLALKEEKKILGCKCSKCGLVRVPPFLTHCPDCNFAPTKPVEVEQTGKMNSTPPITYFATALFQHMAPYGRGRVLLHGADTAMSVNLYTTTGILVPGIIRKGTEVKLVFKDSRIGSMTDVFCVPAAELNAQQLSKKGLQESEIDWEKPTEPELRQPSESDKTLFTETIRGIKSIIQAMNNNDRARKDIAGWKRDILVKTRGGEFTILIDDGNISLKDVQPGKPDFIIVCDDPRILLDGLAYRGAITDSVINKKLWISKNMEFNTIFKLDRMARSVARARKLAKTS